jgi:hypothetical protein
VTARTVKSSRKKYPLSPTLGQFISRRKYRLGETHKAKTWGQKMASDFFAPMFLPLFSNQGRGWDFNRQKAFPIAYPNGT